MRSHIYRMDLINKYVENNITYFSNGCWAWNGSVNKWNVPTMVIRGSWIAVIKITFLKKFGYKPLWKHMRRTCKLDRCLNPEHYIDQTPASDRQPTLLKKRERYWGVFSEEECAVIWERVTLGGERQKDIAKEKKVHPRTILRVVQRYHDYLYWEC